VDFVEEIRAIAIRIKKTQQHIKTEEATKQAFVIPFIKALGYDVYDPTEVVPEFTADVGKKKGEKVDYAIMQNETPIMLIEAKKCSVNLEHEHKGQLFRYFSVTNAQVGVLTNGIIFRFYTDLEKPNQMDDRPFLEFNMLNIHDDLVKELKRFTKAKFNLDEIVPAAAELKYTQEIKAILAEQLKTPNEDFVKFFASRVYSGQLRQKVIDQFTEMTKQALHQFINERIDNRLRSALNKGDPNGAVLVPIQKTRASSQSKHQRNSKGIDTNPDEIEGLRLIKEIIKDTVDPKRVFLLDTVRYSIILLDDSKKNVICRMHFNSRKKKKVEFLDCEQPEIIPINDVSEIKQFTERLQAIAKTLDAAPNANMYKSNKPMGKRRQTLST